MDHRLAKIYWKLLNWHPASGNLARHSRFTIFLIQKLIEADWFKIILKHEHHLL